MLSFLEDLKKPRVWADCYFGLYIEAVGVTGHYAESPFLTWRHRAGGLASATLAERKLIHFVIVFTLKGVSSLRVVYFTPGFLQGLYLFTPTQKLKAV